jgi:nickel-dependent lactate racemase
LTRFLIPYGKTQLSVDIPDERQIDIIAPPDIPGSLQPFQTVEHALAKPVGAKFLSNFAGAKSAAIAINDKTRPVPHKYLLPPLLEQLDKLGIPSEAIKLIIATGTHPPMADEEFASVVPSSILKRYPVFSHDAKDKSNLVYIGKTSRNTPVWINRQFYDAQIRIVVGNIEPHQFQGFSGGVKSAAIGLAGLETVNINHSMMTHPDARLGEYDKNPARQDIEEVGQQIGIHFALNAILNEKKEIVQAIAGDPYEVMKTGIALVRQICQVGVQANYDLMITSPGGHPKDINLYQSQKGLAHSCLITRKGGTVILVAACSEGTGSHSYERWMTGLNSYKEIIERFQREGFRIGPHKAFQIARDASSVQLMLFSEMQLDLAQSLLLNPVNDLQTAIDSTLKDLPPNARIGVMPRASATIPYIIS